VRRWNFAFQKGLAKANRKAARRVGGQDAEQSPPGRHPGERPLQHTHKQVALMELPHHEGREGQVGLEIGAEQDAGGLDTLGS
jgi:hypothetical protein